MTAQQTADEAVRECGGSPSRHPGGGPGRVLLDAADVAWSDFEAAAMAEPEAGP